MLSDQKKRTGTCDAVRTPSLIWFIEMRLRTDAGTFRRSDIYDENNTKREVLKDGPVQMMSIDCRVVKRGRELLVCTVEGYIDIVFGWRTELFVLGTTWRIVLKIVHGCAAMEKVVIYVVKL